MKVYVFTSDNDNGTNATVYLHIADAYTDFLSIIVQYNPDSEVVAKLAAHIKASDFEAFDILVSELNNEEDGRGGRLFKEDWYFVEAQDILVRPSITLAEIEASHAKA